MGRAASSNNLSYGSACSNNISYGPPRSGKSAHAQTSLSMHSLVHARAAVRLYH